MILIKSDVVVSHFRTHHERGSPHDAERIGIQHGNPGVNVVCSRQRWSQVKALRRLRKVASLCYD